MFEEAEGKTTLYFGAAGTGLQAAWTAGIGTVWRRWSDFTNHPKPEA